MSKINEALVMMAEQKEVFKIGDRKFQIIEVKEAVNNERWLVEKSIFESTYELINKEQ